MALTHSTTANDSNTGLSVLNFTPAHVGDLVILSIVHDTNAAAVTALTASNIAWSSTPAAVSVSSQPWRAEIWVGVATSTAAANTTLSWSSAIGGAWCNINMDSFTGLPGGSTWQVDDAGGASSTVNSLVVSTPSLTSAAAGEIAWYTGWGASSSSVGATAGFVYVKAANGQVVCYNLNTAAATAYSPTWTQATTGRYNTVGVIVAAVAAGSPRDVVVTPKPRYMRQAVQRSSLW